MEPCVVRVAQVVVSTPTNRVLVAQVSRVLIVGSFFLSKQTFFM